MACVFSKYIIETKTHYVGKTGNEYPYDEYMNWGTGEENRGYKDHPLDEYPYTIKYKKEYKWKCCRECNCEDKEPL